MSVLVCHSYPKAKVAQRKHGDIPHHRPHFGGWSHFLEEPSKASLGLKMPAPVFFLKLSLLRAKEQQRLAFLPRSESHQSTPSPPPFSYIFFFMYNEASRD